MTDARPWNTSRPTRKVREVYFIRANGLNMIKIGVSDNPRARLKQLQKAIPDTLELLGVVVCEDYGKLERHLHGLYAHYRVTGEWFSAAPDILAYIASHADAPMPAKRLADMNASRRPASNR